MRHWYEAEHLPFMQFRDTSLKGVNRVIHD
jgi:hypothetical protein